MSVGYRPGLDQPRAGRFNRPVSLYSPTTVRDATGFSAPGPATKVRGLRAYVDTQKGQELRESSKEISERWAVIGCRYAAAKDAQETWSFLHVIDGITETWDIRSILPLEASRKTIEFLCRQVR